VLRVLNFDVSVNRREWIFTFENDYVKRKPISMFS